MLNLVLINDWGLHMGLFCSCEVQKMGRDRMILALTVAECCSYFSLFEIWSFDIEFGADSDAWFDC